MKHREFRKGIPLTTLLFAVNRKTCKINHAPEVQELVEQRASGATDCLERAMEQEAGGRLDKYY